MNNDAIINLINDNIELINQYEQLFTTGKFNESNQLFSDNIKKFSDTIELIISFYTMLDKDDKSGYQKLWIGVLQNMVNAFKADDIFYRYDVLCYDIRYGFHDFNNTIGEFSR